jgi:PKD repeat protein
MLRTITLLVVGLILSTATQAQGPVKCATMEQDSINRIKYPGLGELDDFEKVLQQKIWEMEKKSKSSRTQEEIYTIPVIVHVINQGEPVGSGSNISLAQVQSQIEVLNEDFRKKVGTKGDNSNPVGADIEIEFCLAIVDPNGKALAEPGIHRYNGNKATWTRTEIESSLKPNTIWDPDKYYNVWTLNLGGEDARVLGYAQFPSQSNLPGLQENGGPASTDGVVVSYKHFGSAEKGNFTILEAPYNKGRTLTHETGHYLGLRHIWGDGGCGADDFVSDTPDSDAASSGCQIGRKSCGVVNMVENYMDYSNDDCMNIFTKGQRTRMRAVMQISPRRNSLFTANVCSPPVAAKPAANFRSDKTFVLRGGSVNYTDLSSNFPTKWLWTFEGGEPSSSSLRNPSVKYTVSDTFKVTLIATNELGSDTIERDKYIIVSPQGVCSDTTNFKGTPALLKHPDSSVQGYLAGHNSLKDLAKAEYFDNKLGYNYINRARIKFGKAYSTKDDATVKVTVWNARGPQGAPGAVVEETEVLLKRIQEDIANNRETEIVFTRLAPVFGRGFFVGIQLIYTGDTVAMITSSDGDADLVTAWQKDASGKWDPYTTKFGINVAHAVTAVVGIEPGVQLAASSLSVLPGDKVTIDAKGASIFTWTSDDGSVVDALGPQITVYPFKTTTYTVKGGGLTLCDTTATLTLFVNAPNGVEQDILNKQLRVSPNPSAGKFKIEMENELTGALTLDVINSIGQGVMKKSAVKNKRTFTDEIDLTSVPSGVYILQLKVKDKTIRKKIIKN